MVQLVDDKHRVSIPSRFRDILIANTDPDMMKDGPFALIGLHPEFPCLIGYDAGWSDEENAREPEAGEDTGPYFNRMQGLGEGDELRFDSTGRVTLAPYQRRQVGINKHAFFRGAYNHFEIWDPQTLLDHPGVNERAKIACRGLMEDKGLL
jgi:MraZ protein